MSDTVRGGDRVRDRGNERQSEKRDKERADVASMGVLIGMEYKQALAHRSPRGVEAVSAHLTNLLIAVACCLIA